MFTLYRLLQIYQIKNLVKDHLDPYPQRVMDEMEEDLEGICNTLTDLGVKVHRPIDKDFSEPIKTENWEVDGIITIIQEIQCW